MRVLRDEKEMGNQSLNSRVHWVTKSKPKRVRTGANQSSTLVNSNGINYTYTIIYVLRHQFNSSNWRSAFYFSSPMSIGTDEVSPAYVPFRENFKGEGTPMWLHNSYSSLSFWPPVLSHHVHICLIEMRDLTLSSMLS